MRPIVKVPMKYGAIAGVLGAVLVIGLFYLGKHPFLIEIYLDFRIFIFGIFIFFVLRELRDFVYGGILYFWQGIIASFLFTLFFALLASSLIGLFGLMEPSFVTEFIRQSTEKLALVKEELIERLGKEAFDSNLRNLPATNAWDLAIHYYIQSFVIGTFIGILLSVILRRQPKPQ
jgi:hypothetical protein